MDHPDLLSELTESGVVEVADKRDEYALTDEFVAVTDEADEQLDEEGSASLDATANQQISDDRERQFLLDLTETNEALVARHLALIEFIPDTSPRDRLRKLTVVDQFFRSPPHSNGAPEQFLAVHGDQLQAFLKLYGRAIVYVWREDCSPCDTMKDEFEEMLEFPDDIACLAVYGPDWAQLLYDEYDVRGGPTTLFIVDGTVDSRLHGAHYGEVIEREIETIEAYEI